MSENIYCPKCGHEHNISKMELYQVYDEDGKETEIDCNGCELPIIITSSVTGWSFDVELRDED